VAFAEVEKFLDTPVKRYSSGMYVRLAFAVAAHLEPEVLVVDEVLAVGDAQFQKKCLGKMEDVGKEGRTVLFVSHNMGTILQLCNHCIWLEHGKVKSTGSVAEIIGSYMQSSFTKINTIKRSGNAKIIFDDFLITDTEGNERSSFFMGDSVIVHLSLFFQEKVDSPIVAIEIRNALYESFAHIINIDDDFFIENVLPQRNVKLKIEIPQILFTPSIYFFSLWVGENMTISCDYLVDCMSIEIMQGDKIKRVTPYPSHVKVFMNSKWEQIND
jgi:lipopolysaccharide transport system ATP-binding protein